MDKRRYRWNLIHALAVKKHKEIMKNNLLAIALLVFVLSACGRTADGGAILPTLMPDMPGQAQAPIPSYLEINGQVQTAKVGSYCWDYTDENGKPVGGACQDSIGISTPIEPLPAAKTITAQLSLPYATPPNILSLGISAVSSENEILLEEGAGLRLWEYTEGINRELDLQPRQEVKVELEPGLYIFNIWAVWDDKGEVTYGFLVEVK
jgi:hypothetical protein